MWNITGNVRKDTSGVIQINISISEIDKAGYVGHFSYTINSDNNVIGSFDCNQNTDELLFQYANTLVDKIAELRHVCPEEIAACTTENAKRFFRLSL